MPGSFASVYVTFCGKRRAHFLVLVFFFLPSFPSALRFFGCFFGAGAGASSSSSSSSSSSERSTSCRSA